MKSILILLLLSSAVARGQTNRVPLTPLYLSALAEEARANHPGLRAATARSRAAAENERAVKLWDDPEFMFGGIVGPGVMREEEGDLVYGLEQKLPINGKPQAERAVARAETAVVEANKEWRFQTLRRDIAEAAFRLALNEEVARVRQQDLEWVETLSATMLEHYKAGRSTQAELLRMQTEQATRAEQVRVAEKDRESEQLLLNRLLNRPLDSKWPLLELPVLAAPLANNERLLSLAVKFEPKLRMMRLETIRAEAGATAAKRERRPDFSLGVDGRQFAGDGQFKEGTVYFKMSIPWINKSKYDAAYHREKGRAEAAAWDAAEYEAELREEIARLAIRIDNARRQAVLYRDEIIPRAEQAFAAAESSWGGGRSLFFEVIEGRRMLLDARLMLARATAEQHLALAELVLCCGLGDLEAVELFQKTNPTEK